MMGKSPGRRSARDFKTAAEEQARERWATVHKYGGKWFTADSGGIHEASPEDADALERHIKVLRGEMVKNDE